MSCCGLLVAAPSSTTRLCSTTCWFLLKAQQKMRLIQPSFSIANETMTDLLKVERVQIGNGQHWWRASGCQRCVYPIILWLHRKPRWTISPWWKKRTQCHVSLVLFWDNANNQKHVLVLLWQAAQLSLTNRATANGKFLKQSRDHSNAHLGGDMSSFW